MPLGAPHLQLGLLVRPLQRHVARQPHRPANDGDVEDGCLAHRGGSGWVVGVAEVCVATEELNE